MQPKLKIFLNFNWPPSAVQYFRKEIKQADHVVLEHKENDCLVWNLTEYIVTKPYYVFSDSNPDIKITDELWNKMASQLLNLELQWLKDRENGNET